MNQHSNSEADPMFNWIINSLIYQSIHAIDTLTEVSKQLQSSIGEQWRGEEIVD